MSPIRCPRCGAEVNTNYGHTKSGKQRWVCSICSRHFIAGVPGKETRKRPVCPLCGGKMHVYMNNVASTRFRCAAYPGCRGYAQISRET